MKKSKWTLDASEGWSTEGYWASYSDLMAGILLVFAIAAASSWIAFQHSLVKPTEPLQEWQRFLNAICNDRELTSHPGIKINCNTGSLVFSEASLRYARSATDLSDEGKALLRRVVPSYLRIVENHLRPDGKREGIEMKLEGVEISGHTDSTGDYGSNSYISRERAGKVLLFLLQTPELRPFRGLLRQQGYAVGYADSRSPDAVSPSGTDDWPEARRIEIQVHIDKASILKELKGLLDSLRLTK